MPCVLVRSLFTREEYSPFAEYMASFVSLLPNALNEPIVSNAGYRATSYKYLRLNVHMVVRHGNVRVYHL